MDKLAIFYVELARTTYESTGSKIDAIKAIRENSTLSLAGAKQIVDMAVNDAHLIASVIGVLNDPTLDRRTPPERDRSLIGCR